MCIRDRINHTPSLSSTSRQNFHQIVLYRLEILKFETHINPLIPVFQFQPSSNTFGNRLHLSLPSSLFAFNLIISWFQLLSDARWRESANIPLLFLTLLRSSLKFLCKDQSSLVIYRCDSISLLSLVLTETFEIYFLNDIIRGLKKGYLKIKKQKLTNITKLLHELIYKK